MADIPDWLGQKGSVEREELALLPFLLDAKMPRSKTSVDVDSLIEYLKTFKSLGPAAQADAVNDLSESTRAELIEVLRKQKVIAGVEKKKRISPTEDAIKEAKVDDITAKRASLFNDMKRTVSDEVLRAMNNQRVSIGTASGLTHFCSCFYHSCL